MAKFAFVVDGEVGVVWQVKGHKETEDRTTACLMSAPEIVLIDDDMVVASGWKWDGTTFSPPAVG